MVGFHLLRDAETDLLGHLRSSRCHPLFRSLHPFGLARIFFREFPWLRRTDDRDRWDQANGGNVRKPTHGNLEHYVTMAAFYIRHNAGIGLQCFGFGPLIIPSLFTLGYNAVQLGAVFGYMARPDVDAGDNFFHFVTAHGPFELTAIALYRWRRPSIGSSARTTCASDRSSFRIRIHRSKPPSDYCLRRAFHPGSFHGRLHFPFSLAICLQGHMGHLVLWGHAVLLRAAWVSAILSPIG